MVLTSALTISSGFTHALIIKSSKNTPFDLLPIT